MNSSDLELTTVQLTEWRSCIGDALQRPLTHNSWTGVGGALS